MGVHIDIKHDNGEEQHVDGDVEFKVIFETLLSASSLEETSSS